MERRLAALLMADVVGYSRLMEADEAGTLAALRQWQDAILMPAVAAHGGRIVKLVGDGVLVEFASAVNAVSAALALQSGTSAASEAAAEGRGIVLRVGVNLGEVLGEGDDVYGESVNVAARLEALAAPGEIYVSGKVRDEVQGRVACRFTDRGEQRLKNMAAPVRVFHVAGDDQPLARAASHGAARSSTRPSIAILPFANLSAEGSGQHLADGLTEDIVTELSRYRQLRVIARDASFRRRDGKADLVQAGRELGVQFVVEGSMRIIGDNLRISVQLIDAVSGHNVWAERFDRETKDVFTIQDQVVRTIAATVLGRVKAAVVETALRKPPASLEAYECVLKADDLPFDDPECAEEAHKLFERAIELDPTYARAYALFANLCGVRWTQDTGEGEELLETALRLARKSVDLDSRNSACQQALGWVYLLRRSFDLAEHHMRKAVELSPNQPTPHSGLAAFLVAVGKRPEALATYEEARRIDSFFEPQWYWPMVGCVLHGECRYEEALAALLRTTSVAYWVNAYLAACYARLGQPDPARAHAAQVRQQLPGFSSSWFVRKEVFKLEKDAQHLLDGLLMAGLPP